VREYDDKIFLRAFDIVYVAIEENTTNIYMNELFAIGSVLVPLKLYERFFVQAMTMSLINDKDLNSEYNSN